MNGVSPGLAAVEVAAVVLDARADPGLGQHLEVVLGAHPQALGLEELVLALELLESLAQLDLDRGDGPLDRVVARHVVGRRVDDAVLHLVAHLAGQDVEGDDPLDGVAEELDPQRDLLVGGVYLDGVAARPEGAAHQVHVVAVVLQVDQAAQERPLLVLLADGDRDDAVAVLRGRPQAVDARHRRHHDHVAPGEERRGGRVAQAVDLVVDRRVLLDVGVGRGQVGLGLVVVVVGDEELDPVVREQVAQLGGQLGGQRLVGLDDERGLLDLRDGPGDRRRLPAPGDPLQRLVAVAPANPLDQPGDRRGLVAGRVERRHDLEFGHRNDRTGGL